MKEPDKQPNPSTFEITPDKAKPRESSRHLQVAGSPEIPAPHPIKRKSRLKTAKLVAEFFKLPLSQSKVKVDIVVAYFGAWTTIINPWARGAMAYFDFFAGPGRYEDGTPSTPVRILELILAKSTLAGKVATFFGDVLPDVIEALKANIAAIPGISSLRYAPEVEVMDAADGSFEKQAEAMHLVPSFLFLDPFGYEGVTAKLIRSVLKDWGCDVIFFFCFRRILGAISNPKVRGHMDEMFGAERVELLRKDLASLHTTGEKEQVVLSALEDAMNSIGGSYVQTFRFRNGKGTITHHLVFVTKNPMAHYVMKEIMAKRSSGHFDEIANFEFAIQESLVSDLRIEDLMDDLLDKFKGRARVSIEQIVDEHHYGTPYLRKNYQEALRRLCYDRKLITAERGEMRPKLKPERRDMPFEETYITFP